MKAPLPELTDGEILLLVALHYEELARGGATETEQLHRRGIAARLRALKRRVPLWTDRREAA